jgi:RNA polymerase sigma-B factor
MEPDRRCSSLDAPTEDDAGSRGPRFDAALGRLEPEFDLVVHRESLAPLLAELPERERSFLVLRFFRGMIQTEIAERVGLSQMHVSRLLARTLATLHRRLAVD